jgi:bile acid:Na+ symporter, BASS family
MGLTLGWRDFREVARRPGAVAFGLGLQYLVMPLAAVFTAWLLRLPPELAVGLVIVGCCPGGTASNVIAWLARADVALSISLTFASTLLAVFVTPALVALYVGAAMPVSAGSLVWSLVQIVVLPVAAGMALGTLAGRRIEGLRRLAPSLSVAAIVLVIAIIVAVNRENLAATGLLILAAVVLHNLIGLGAGYGAARMLRLPEPMARTLAIEVGMQNSGLGVALALQHFSPVAALPGALFSVWHNLSGSLLAWWWRGRAARASTST